MRQVRADREESGQTPAEPRLRHGSGEERYGPNASVSGRGEYGPDAGGLFREGYSYDVDADFSTPSARTGGPYAGIGPKGYTPSNERLYERVCERLMLDSDIDASDIEVRVEDGEVYMAGTVDSRRTKRAAEDAADAVGGVHDVHNQLRVRRDDGQFRRT